MRWLGVLIAVSIAPAATAGRASDPAFLGIGMHDNAPGCRVDQVIQSSAADDAGLRIGDVIVAIDDNPTQACQVLTNGIIAHSLGDTVRLDLHRGYGRMVVKATLTSRSEVLHRRFVGRPIDGFDATGEDGSPFELSELHGRPTVIGWFDVHHCVGCAAIFDQIETRLHARMGDSAPRLLAITGGSPDNLKTLRASFASSVSLAIADEESPYVLFASGDPGRVHLMVLDTRGTVRFATPIAPDDDDLDAALDEVIAASEQAEHARRR